MKELIDRIKEYCQKYEGEVTAYQKDFCAMDYSGGNYDDAWDSGMSDGQTDACNNILGIIADFTKEKYE